MRRKAKLYSKNRDETEDVVQIIHFFEDNHKISTKSAVIDKLMELKKINKETANENVECSLCLGAIVILYINNEKILKDTLRLKEQRHLIVKSYMDVNSIVLQTLKECGAKNKKMSRSILEIEKHILLTYNVKTSLQNVSLSNLIEKAIYSLLKKEVVLRILDPESNQFRYYFPHDFLEDEKNLITDKHKRILTYCEENVPSTSYYHEKSRNLSVEVEEKFTKRNNSLKKKEKTKSVDASQIGSAKGELKQLQDSLSQFFTPSNIRRLNSFNLENKITKELLVEQEDSYKSSKKALEIVIDESIIKNRESITDSSDGSFRSSVLSSTTPSPHRRHDQLHDALSSYFSVNTNERRRKHEKGEYFIMNSGTTPRKKQETLNYTETENLTADCTEENKSVKNELNEENEPSQNVSPIKRLLRTPRSQLSNSQRRFNLRNLNNLSQIRKETRRSLVGEKANKLLKRACDRAIVRQNQINSPTCSPVKKKALISPYKNKSDAERQVKPASFTKLKKNSLSAVNRCLTSPIKSVKSNSFKTTNLSALNSDESVWNIPEEDRKLFDQAREIAQKQLYENNKFVVKDPEKQAYPARIQIGNYEINSWYSSPYPQEYIGLPILYICESCLTYLSEQHPHIVKCKATFPPGNEIYRNNNISVFEVDGNLARVYCRNLCLLAKLFIDHKTLYFDVEPFLFYVMTINDNYGVHFVGYFSKEKFSSQKYNLACIVTLPCYQGKGYGRFLIDFSYLLTRKENMLGSPEQPLSDLGRIAYQSYWNSAIFEFLFNAIIINSKESISINDVSQATGITHQDVLDTFVANNMIHNACDLVINLNQIKNHWYKVKSSTSRIWIDEEKLQWSPKIYSPSKEFHSDAKLVSPQKNDAENLAQDTTEIVEKKIFNKKSAKRNLNSFNLINDNIEEKIKLNVFGRKRLQKSSIESMELNIEDSAFLSEDEDDDLTYRQTKTMSCNTKIDKKYNRKTPSTDGDVTFIKKIGSKVNGKHKNSFVKSIKSRKSSRNKKHTSKEFDNNKESVGSSVVNTSEKINKRDTKVIAKNKITLSSDSDENLQAASNNDSTSEYEMPKRKFTTQNSKKKVVKSSTKRFKKTGKRKSKKNNRFTKKQMSIDKEDLSLKNIKNNICDNDEDIENLNVNDTKTLKNSLNLKNENNEFEKVKKEEQKNRTSNDSTTTSDHDSSDDDKKSTKKLSYYSMKSNKMLRNINSKKRTLNYYGRHHQLYDSSDDNIDEACCSSSTSPQPLGDRLPIIQTSNQEPETINMGGEPDTINVGGEPDQDGAILPVQNVFSPKAPLAPLINNEGNPEDDEVQDSETYKLENMMNIEEPVVSNQQVLLPKNFNQIFPHETFDFQRQNNNCNSMTCLPNQISQPFAVNNMYNNCDLSIQQRIDNFVNNIEDNQHKMSLNVNSNLPHLQTYYPVQQQKNSLNNEGINMQSNYLNSSESDQFGILKEKISDKSLLNKNRNADMPILDSLSSIPLNHIEDIVLKEVENDDDEAPPQLSPNIPSHEPLSPNNDQKLLEDTVIESAADSLSSIVNTNTNSSINESIVKRHIETALNSVSAVNMSYESVRSGNPQLPNATPNILKTQDDILMQQTQNLSENYDFNQRQLKLSKFNQNVTEYSAINSSIPRYSNSANLPTVDSQSTNVLPQSSSNLIGTYENDYKQQIFSPNICNQLANPMSAGTTAIVNHSPNQQTTSSASTKNDVISPQNSLMPTLIASQQPNVSDYNSYHNKSLASSNAIKRSSNEHQQHMLYNNQINSTYLTPTLTIPDQTSWLNLVDNINKKSKKLTKEKSTKSTKRVKNNENNRSQSVNAQPNMSCILPTSSSLTFVNPVWSSMTDYNPMQQAMMAAQFMSASSQSMGFHPNATQYYPQPNYFNVASIANNYTQHQYPAMSTNSLYNNPAAWSHYCANYSNLGYPALRNNDNNPSNPQPTISSAANVDTSNSSATTSWPISINPAFSNLINNNLVNNNETLNNTALAANPLNAVNTNSFYPSVAYQNLNLHQLYSSYSAHT